MNSFITKSKPTIDADLSDDSQQEKDTKNEEGDEHFKIEKGVLRKKDESELR